MGQQAGYYQYGASSQVRPTEQFAPNQFGQNVPFHMSMQFPPYPSASFNQIEQPYVNQNSYQLETAIRKER